MLALCLSGALAAPVSKSHHAVAAARSDFLVTETLSADPSDYASDYGPDMEAQKKQLKALRKENRIAAEKVAEVSGDGKTAASMLQRHSHWDEDTDEDDEELSSHGRAEGGSRQAGGGAQDRAREANACEEEAA